MSGRGGDESEERQADTSFKIFKRRSVKKNVFFFCLDSILKVLL